MGSGQPNRVKSVLISLEKAGDESEVSDCGHSKLPAGVLFVTELRMNPIIMHSTKGPFTNEQIFVPK